MSRPSIDRMIRAGSRSWPLAMKVRGLARIISDPLAHLCDINGGIASAGTTSAAEADQPDGDKRRSHQPELETRSSSSQNQYRP